jgi:hypothetical protein
VTEAVALARSGMTDETNAAGGLVADGAVR